MTPTAPPASGRRWASPDDPASTPRKGGGGKSTSIFDEKEDGGFASHDSGHGDPKRIVGGPAWRGAAAAVLDRRRKPILKPSALSVPGRPNAEGPSSPAPTGACGAGARSPGDQTQSHAQDWPGDRTRVPGCVVYAKESVDCRLEGIDPSCGDIQRSHEEDTNSQEEVQAPGGEDGVCIAANEGQEQRVQDAAHGPATGTTCPQDGVCIDADEGQEQCVRDAAIGGGARNRFPLEGFASYAEEEKEPSVQDAVLGPATGITCLQEGTCSDAERPPRDCLQENSSKQDPLKVPLTGSQTPQQRPQNFQNLEDHALDAQEGSHGPQEGAGSLEAEDRNPYPEVRKQEVRNANREVRNPQMKAGSPSEEVWSPQGMAWRLDGPVRNLQEVRTPPQAGSKPPQGDSESPGLAVQKPQQVGGSPLLDVRRPEGHLRSCHEAKRTRFATDSSRRGVPRVPVQCTVDQPSNCHGGHPPGLRHGSTAVRQYMCDERQLLQVRRVDRSCEVVCVCEA